MSLLKQTSYFSLRVTVFTLGSSLSDPRLQRLTSDLSSQGGVAGDGGLQTLVLNNSQATRDLRGRLWTLQSQVPNYNRMCLSC